MTMNIVLDARKRLRVAVTGEFDCEVARELMRRFRMNWPARARALHLDLKGVTEFRQGAIELLVLLLEMTGGELSLEGCSDELEAAYVSVLTGAAAAPNAGSACRDFLLGGECAVCSRGACP
ncbi:hypothetical protein SUTH_00617 [Sulfuritalea hydrogenivorans sk43H]|jgi:hypothetical protein|uniref:STAS domain-containing protein n=2 Tax=Sulfuritalea hydrogenivorans TaxID=748811 RepID=W0SBN5_9PROT|nr:hypothetical protein SUTH_00617 [Sulfuritalea hydrogenivorans sk43H]